MEEDHERLRLVSVVAEVQTGNFLIWGQSVMS